MKRGLFLGGICGSLVGLIFLGLLSIIDQMPGNLPPDAQIESDTLDPASEEKSEVPAKDVFYDTRPALETSPKRVELGGAEVSPTLPLDVEGKISNFRVPSVEGRIEQSLDFGSFSEVLKLEKPRQFHTGSNRTRIANLVLPQTEVMPRPQILTRAAAPVSIIPVSQPTAALNIDPLDGLEDLDIRAFPGVQVRPLIDAAIVWNGPVSISAPQIESSSLPTSVPAPAPSLAAAQQTVTPEFIPAIEAFALPFVLAPELPIVSFVLLDTENDNVDLRDIAGLPFPVTIAVDASSETAFERSQQLANVGLELAVTGDLPAGAGYYEYVTAVPSAIAIVEGAGLGLSGSATRLNALRTDFLETGHGFLATTTQASSAVRRARSAGIPAATVFRDLDKNNQDARVMRRFIDQAAFLSRQEGIVILLARLRPETIEALQAWGVRDRSSTYNVAPLSTAMMALF